ncbi:ABC transporter permease subunit [Virgisporangium aurantiacum]|uniref:ABC transporter n=1 Tax=Virgisporangium aurantiacum TaxID=175570 RepID=A0A8J3Z5N3_9ACTN|nr:ABC transporter permease subunit [Virgisporangium aurantiacum]GIJ55463.1 ABC transporter [Virgisporangium aurantiacum]
MNGIVRSEWTKVRSLRSVLLTVALTVVCAVVFGVLISSGQAREYGTLSAADRAAFDPTYVSLIGSFVFAQLAIGALGVLSVTSEYATGTIRPTLAAVPYRGRLLGAKAIVLGAAAFGVANVAVFAAYLSGQPTLSGLDAPSSTLDDPHVLRAVLGAGWWLTAVALLGVGVGMIVRSTAGAFTVVVASTLLIPLIGGLLPAWFARWWPTSAGQQIMRVMRDPEALSPWAGITWMYVAVAGVLLLGYVSLRFRDA